MKLGEKSLKPVKPGADSARLGLAAPLPAGASLALRRAPQARCTSAALARGAGGERAPRVEAEAPRRRRPRVFWEMGLPGTPRRALHPPEDVPLSSRTAFIAIQ